MKTATPNRKTVAPMVITVPPRLAAKLRQQLALLEMPESWIKLDVLQTLAGMTEDDSYVAGSWTYSSAEQAERVARRVFKRGAGRIELAYGDSENATVVEFIDGAMLGSSRDEDGRQRVAEIHRAIKQNPDQYRVLS